MGARIKEERLRNKLSQTALGAKCGLPASTISAVERGHTVVWPGWRRRLAIALNVAERDLFPDEVASAAR